MRKRVVMLLLGVSLAMSIAGCGGEKEKTYTQSEVDAMMEEKESSGRGSEETAEKEMEKAEKEAKEEMEKAEKEAKEASEKETKKEEKKETKKEEKKESDGVDPELKEFLDSYEKCMDEYIAFMEKYNESDNPVSMMGDYTEMLAKYAEFAEKADQYDEDEMSDADVAYYLEVMNRVNKKLIDASL